MVTSRQITRGVFRTMRAMDRAAKQAERQRVARQNALAKQALLNASAQAAAEYDSIVEAMTGAHRIAFERRDWGAIATETASMAPARRTDAEDVARVALENYRPGWFTRIMGREEAGRTSLLSAVESARRQDELRHEARVNEAASRNAEIARAQRVVEGHADALVEALETYSDLGNLPFAVEGMDTLFVGERMIAIVDGLDLDDVPEESITLLKSGKASIKAISAGRRQEMHRDAICSAAVRVATEFLATLPIDEVEILMLTDVLDRASGHITAEPVLHLRATVQPLRAINLGRADAAALVDRLGGYMDWSKRDGFRAINAAAFGIDLPREEH